MWRMTSRTHAHDSSEILNIKPSDHLKYVLVPENFTETVFVNFTC